MSKFATLFAVDDDCAGVSLSGELLELLFPKPSFHLLGFFVIVCVCGTGDGGGRTGDGPLTLTLTAELPSGESGELTMLPERDVRLISRASAWLALARTSSVWSCGDTSVGETHAAAAAAAATAPLPLRAPRLRRFACDALRDPGADSCSWSCS